MKILHLTLKKEWYDMILSGEKKEEYRDIKHYWKTRLVEYISNHSHLYNQPHLKHDYNIEFKHFDVVEFRNGYQKDARRMRVEIKNIRVDKSIPKWGGDGKYCFAIELGKIIISAT